MTNVGKYVSVVGGVLTVVGAFLPWVVVGGQTTVSGVQGQGLFAVTFCAIALGVIAFREWRPPEQAVVVSMGLLVLIVVLNVFNGLDELPAGQSIALTTDPAIGLYVSLLGGVALALGGALGYVLTPDDAEESPDSESDTVGVPEQLRRYKQLEEEGVLTEAEFKAKKAELLE
ncbi:SHOCT domain-containing protein [Halostella litorea]|uniref:SHOCT domain-containing protein n=1 Tax=Halostella litorea TaxID=2528831 RepID=UPI0010922308|nr:SHOCT domain-containing protein [Halostella litorea]